MGVEGEIGRLRQAFGEDGDYEAVAASATNQVMGTAGAVGDVLSRVIVIPAAAAPGIVQVKDGSLTAVTIYVGGATITTTQPVSIELRMKSISGAWQITTGAGVSAIGVGNFT